VTSIRTINAWERSDYAAAGLREMSRTLQEKRASAIHFALPLPRGFSAEEERNWILSAFDLAIDHINQAKEHVRAMPDEDLPEFSEALKDLIRQEQNVTA